MKTINLNGKELDIVQYTFYDDFDNKETIYGEYIIIGNQPNMDKLMDELREKYPDYDNDCIEPFLTKKGKELGFIVEVIENQRIYF